MKMPTNRRKNKLQIRTVETQTRILDAAEASFSEQGFEKTQLEEVASRAGYTRGAIYAHYSSKEDLFLALLEQRIFTRFTDMRRELEAEPDIRKRQATFKGWILDKANEPSWSTLILEFKLYAMRRPEARGRLQHVYEIFAESSGSDFIELLFGAGLENAARAGIERRLAIMGALLSAVFLESHFQPKALTKTQISAVLDEVYDALIHA